MSNHQQSLPLIGKNVKKERLNRKWSLDDLARASGVSKAMLSQIESDKVNPTVAIVWKIAQALRADLNLLIRGDGERIRKFEVNRREDITSLDTDAAGVHINVLSPIAMAEDIELYLLTFQPGAVFKSNSHIARTEEILTVLEGRVKVTAGGRSATLDEGDVVIYECDVRHCIENLGDKARIFMVVRFGSNQY